MELSIGNYLIVNVLVLSLVVYYLLRRRPRSRMRLSMGKGGQSKPDLIKGEDFDSKLGAAQVTPDSSQRSPNVDEVAQRRKEKSLNVFFNYNGHSWDAFEVLGLPAGSSIEKVREVYEENLKLVDMDSRSFLECAYKAIVSHLKA